MNQKPWHAFFHNDGTGYMYRALVLRIAETILLGICLSAGLNLLFYLTNLTNLLSGAQTVESMYAHDLFTEICLYGLAAPAMEEIVFRKFLYQKLFRAKAGILPSVVLSALLFGIYHGNLLQFLYACILGVVLALAIESDRTVLAPIRLHAAINCTAILITETGWLAAMLQHRPAGAGLTAVLLLVSALLIRRLFFPLRKD